MILPALYCITSNLNIARLPPPPLRSITGASVNTWELVPIGDMSYTPSNPNFESSGTNAREHSERGYQAPPLFTQQSFGGMSALTGSGSGQQRGEEGGGGVSTVRGGM